MPRLYDITDSICDSHGQILLVQPKVSAVIDSRMISLRFDYVFGWVRHDNQSVLSGFQLNLQSLRQWNLPKNAELPSGMDQLAAPGDAVASNLLSAYGDTGYDVP